MRRTATAVALGVAMAMGVTACGAGLEPRSTPDAAAPTTASAGVEDDGPGETDATDEVVAAAADTGSSVEVLEATVDRTAAAESGRYELVVLYDTASTGAEFPIQQVRAVGEFSPSGVHYTMEYTPDQGLGTFEVTIVDGIGYLEVPGSQCGRVDMSDASVAVATGGAAVDPAAALDQLRGIDGDVSEVGELVIRDVPTTHFAAAFTARDALTSASEEQADGLERAYAGLPDSFLDADQQVDLFVDDDGLLRRMQVQSPAAEMAGVQVPSVTTIADFYDFGADVTVVAPTGCAEVTTGFQTVPVP